MGVREEMSPAQYCEGLLPIRCLSRGEREIKKSKYIYYHCTGHRGKCELPYFREEEIGNRLGGILQDIQVPDDILGQLETSLLADKSREQVIRRQKVDRLQQRLTTVHRHLPRTVPQTPPPFAPRTKPPRLTPTVQKTRLIATNLPRRLHIRLEASEQSKYSSTMALSTQWDRLG